MEDVVVVEDDDLHDVEYLELPVEIDGFLDAKPELDGRLGDALDDDARVVGEHELLHDLLNVRAVIEPWLAVDVHDGTGVEAEDGPLDRWSTGTRLDGEVSDFQASLLCRSRDDRRLSASFIAVETKELWIRAETDVI